MFHFPFSTPRRLVFLALGLSATFLGGCASEDFTLEADLPGGFQLSGDAEYSQPTGHACSDSAGQDVSHHRFTTPGHGARPQRVSFQVPLSQRSGGCTLQLSRIQIQLDGETAPHPQAATRPVPALAVLSIRDYLPASAWEPPSTGTIIFDGQCRWLLPPPSAGSSVARQLQCSASDLQGRWFDAMPGGTLSRSDLPGRIVRLAIATAADVPATVTALDH